MAIIREPSADADIHLTEAHLDKGGILVDESDIATVGYSIGGNTTGK